jgi:hypothetical protein
MLPPWQPNANPTVTTTPILIFACTIRPGGTESLPLVF